MPATATFDYQVRDRQGQIVKGRLEAESEAAVARKLQSMGYAPITVHQANAGMSREINISIGSGVKLKDLAVMSRQFSTMINSGLSLLRSITILQEQTRSKNLAKSLQGVRVDVEAGSSLSGSMAKYPDIFPPLMINMIRAGEVGGFLDTALNDIAENFEKEVKLRSKVKSAMTYPVVVFIMAILAVTGMLLFIVPVFKTMFEGLGGELPAPTRFLVFLSELLKSWFWVLLILVVAGVIVWGRVRRTERVRRVVDPMKLKIPVFGSLFRKVAISRFTRNLGTMMRSGVPILQGLDIVADTAGNVVISDAVRAAQQSVRAGEPLTKPLSEHPVFPPMVVQMMAVGEDTGALDDMLYKISDFYDQEVEATTDALTSIIEPIMIAILGGLIGAMIIALYLPIFSIFNLIK